MCSVGPRVGGTAVRIGACRKAEVVSPKANPPSGNLRNGACRKAEAVNPKANPPSGNLRNGRQKNQLAEGNPEAVHAESGSREPEGQLAEGNPEAVRAEKRKRKPEGQPAERQLRSGAYRKTETGARRSTRRAAISEAEGGSANPPSGNPEAGRAEKRKP